MEWKQAQELCICRMCPSYYACGENLAFCMPQAAISSCIKVERGCVCPGCPVQAELKFQHEFYCTRGCEKILSRA